MPKHFKCREYAVLHVAQHAVKHYPWNLGILQTGKYFFLAKYATHICFLTWLSLLECHSAVINTDNYTWDLIFSQQLVHLSYYNRENMSTVIILVIPLLWRDAKNVSPSITFTEVYCFRKTANLWNNLLYDRYSSPYTIIHRHGINLPGMFSQWPCHNTIRWFIFPENYRSQQTCCPMRILEIIQTC